MDLAGAVLRQIIEEKGPQYPQKNPFRTYQRLLDGKVPPIQARLMLVTLLAGTAEEAAKEDAGSLSRRIQGSCALRKEAADEIAGIYKTVFSAENIHRWKKKEGCGFQDLCDEKWEFTWEGAAAWSCSTGHVDCWASAKAELKVTDTALARKKAEPLLQKNPFVSAAEIFEFFQSEIAPELARDMKAYVTAEKYYEPDMDDYVMRCEETLQDCCGRMGLDVVSFDGDGQISDYIPDW